jgi:hypothetical protein
MGRAAKRKKQNLKQQREVLHQVECKLPNYHSTVEELQKIPAVAKLFDKMDRLPPTKCSLSPSALELFQSFEKLATGCLERDSDEIARQFWAAAPAIALDVAKTLHIINSLAVGDTVPTVISRRSLEHGIELAYHNFSSGEWRVVSSGLATQPS